MKAGGSKRRQNRETHPQDWAWVRWVELGGGRSLTPLLQRVRRGGDDPSFTRFGHRFEYPSGRQSPRKRWSVL